MGYFATGESRAGVCRVPVSLTDGLANVQGCTSSGRMRTQRRILSRSASSPPRSLSAQSSCASRLALSCLPAQRRSHARGHAATFRTCASSASTSRPLCTRRSSSATSRPFSARPSRSSARRTSPTCATSSPRSMRTRSACRTACGARDSRASRSSRPFCSSCARDALSLSLVCGGRCDLTPIRFIGRLQKLDADRGRLGRRPPLVLARRDAVRSLRSSPLLRLRPRM